MPKPQLGRCGNTTRGLETLGRVGGHIHTGDGCDVVFLSTNEEFIMAKKAKKAVKAKKSVAIRKPAKDVIPRDEYSDAIAEIVRDFQKQWKRHDGIYFGGSRWKLRLGETGYPIGLRDLGQVFVVRTQSGCRIRFKPAPQFVKLLQRKGIEVT